MPRSTDTKFEGSPTRRHRFMTAHQQAEPVRNFLRSHGECFHRAAIARGRCLDESCVFSLDVDARHASIVRSSTTPLPYDAGGACDSRIEISSAISIASGTAPSI